jgi:hypothetical protein
VSRSVVCLVPDAMRAESLATALRREGFAGEDISVLFADRSGPADFAHQNMTKAPEGAAAGASAGGALGGALGWLAGIGTLAIPGAGAFIAAGPIMAALSGAAVGAAVGGVAGSLIGMGIPEFEAKHYEGKLGGGNVLLAVRVADEQEARSAKQIAERHGAESISTVRDAAVPRPR